MKQVHRVLSQIHFAIGFIWLCIFIEEAQRHHMDINEKQMRIQISPIYNVAVALYRLRTKYIFVIIYGNPFQVSTEEGKK